MLTSGSVTGWIGLVRQGDPTAAQHLWQRYFPRLVQLARRKLQDAPRRAADEEDVALSAFDSFCRGVAADRFPQLEDRDDLWHLLVVLTARKATRLVRDQSRLKRGGGAVFHESSLAEEADDFELDRIVGREPTPAFAAEVADECRRLFGLLRDDGLTEVARLKMQGHTAEEIATQFGCVTRTVERKLRLIRTIWSREGRP